MVFFCQNSLSRKWGTIAAFEPNGTGVLDFYMLDGHLAYAADVGTLQNVAMCSPTTTL